MPHASTAPDREVVRRVVDDAVSALRSAFGDDLVSVVLHGSAAEDRLRASSDVNLLVVLRAFDPARADAAREPLRAARAAVRLQPMFVLESELAEAASSFADKFGDIRTRHVVLAGRDVVASLTPPRASAVARLRQSLLNVRLRLREAYVARSLREEQAARAVADFGAALRILAGTLVELEGARAASPREALERIAAAEGDARLGRAVENISTARQQGLLPPGEAAPALLALGDLADVLRARAARLSP